MYSEVILSIAYSEMGISPLGLCAILLFGVLFLTAFVLSSRNMDSKGVLKWMLEKPEDWIGNKK